VAQNCDFCGGDPQCVAFCVPEALLFEHVDSAVATRQRLFAASAAHLT
jgi:hypothetical protein